MSETYGDELGEDERTNPNVALPPDAPEDRSARSSTLPPRASTGPSTAPVPTDAPASTPPRAPSAPPRPTLGASRPLPARPAPSASPALPARPLAARPSSPPASTSSARASALPPPPLPPRPASVRPPSLPPTALPKPSDAPPADGGAVLRQRIVLLENALELARSTIEQQRDLLEKLDAKLASLTAKLEADEASRDARARELEERARADAEARAQAHETRLAELEAAIAGRALVDRVAEALAPRFDGGGSPELARLLLQLEARLRAVEEGSAEARLRIRLDRHGHRLDELEKRVPALETSERSMSETLAQSEARGARHEDRIARLESLFEELADEVREDREALDLAGLRARLDDVETLVLQAGTEEERLKKKLGEQEQTIAALREQLEQVERASLAPPPPSAPTGDDLTLIKGIGPKYARLLRELGVTTYAALAAWTDEDVERVAAHLGIPAARVRKAGWIEAAARLAQ